MTKEEFEKVLDRKASVASKTKLVDWESKKNQWLRHLAEFHSEVEGYLAPYLAKGKLKAERYRVTINEENIGAYEADAILVEIGPEKVTLVPIGTLLFGASGRVDMTGSRGIVKFILTGKDSKRRQNFRVRRGCWPAYEAPRGAQPRTGRRRGACLEDSNPAAEDSVCAFRRGDVLLLSDRGD